MRWGLWFFVLTMYLRRIELRPNSLQNTEEALSPDLFKTSSVGLAGVWISGFSLGRPAFISNWANYTAVLVTFESHQRGLLLSFQILLKKTFWEWIVHEQMIQSFMWCKSQYHQLHPWLHIKAESKDFLPARYEKRQRHSGVVAQKRVKRAKINLGFWESAHLPLP